MTDFLKITGGRPTLTAAAATSAGVGDAGKLGEWFASNASAAIIAGLQAIPEELYEAAELDAKLERVGSGVGSPPDETQTGCEAGLSSGTGDSGKDLRPGTTGGNRRHCSTSRHPRRGRRSLQGWLGPRSRA